MQAGNASGRLLRGLILMRRILTTLALVAASFSSLALAPSAAKANDIYDVIFGRDFKAGAGRAAMSSIPREMVDYPGRDAAGTIVINSIERRLYLVLGEGKAIRYGVGVGRPGFEWGGVQRVSRKEEWPAWTPPPQMLKRRPDLPRYMPGGPSNPLGARAMYLGSSLYRIHGSNEPQTIGQAVSSGCIRMTNEDVTDLFDRVKVGTRVVVIRG
jgi:lipoprotein-anchoring transpeptidase ErfK/SrfK